MIDVFTGTVRKKSKTNTIIWLLVLSITFFVAVVVNIFTGDKSPMKQFTLAFFIIGIALLVWWIVMNNKLKLKLQMNMDNNKDFYISIPLKEGGEIKVDHVAVVIPVWGKVSVGRGARMKDIYLKLYDFKGNNTLTLNYSVGAIHEAPYGFWELEEVELMRYDKGPNVYYCSKVEEIFYLLTDPKKIEIRRP